jgi:hypothetical protein
MTLPDARFFPERDDRDLIESVLDDVERPPVEQETVAVCDGRAAEVDLARRPGRRGDAEELPVDALDHVEGLSVRGGVDAVQVEAVGHQLEVARQRHRLGRLRGSPVPGQRESIEHRTHGVGEVRSPLGDDDVVDERPSGSVQ